MILNARNNLFTFNFPRTLIPDTISNKYKTYLNRIPGNLIEEPIDYLNYSIQSVNLPGISYNPTEQSKKTGGTNVFRDVIPYTELFDEFTITMQLLDGYINYWLMFDLFNYYYSFNNPNPYLPDVFVIRTLDSEGHVIAQIKTDRVLFTELSSLELSYANNSPDFSTFDATFKFNSYNRRIELPDINK